MIDELTIHDIALIHHAHLFLDPGLTVITGESGSGKTALLEGIKLLVGARGQAQTVRDGAQGLLVEGRIFLNDGAEDGHVIQRRLSKTGRGRLTIDGSMATVAELAQGLGKTVDLCGQHEHQRLFAPPTHIELVDDWAKESLEGVLGRWRAAYDEAEQASRALKEVRTRERLSSEQLSEATFILRRINAVNPEPGEFDELREQLDQAEHADELLRAVEEAREAVVGDEGATDCLASAAGSLRSLHQQSASLEEAASTLEEALVLAEDAATTLRTFAESIDLDPQALAAMQERFATLQGLIRSYGPSLDDVLAKRDEAERIVEAAQNGAGEERKAQERCDEAEHALAAVASELDQARLEASQRLEEAVNAQLERLDMKGAKVIVSQRRLPRKSWNRTGPSSLELLYQSGPGIAPRPLPKVPSGGEASRMMLALKVVQGDKDAVDTIVFDEVDAGVGGQAAHSLALVIADLARTHQVLCVTHLAQVAVMADHHVVVTKRAEASGEVPETHIREVEDEERVAEIARMLAGDATDTSLAHARELLDRVGTS